MLDFIKRTMLTGVGMAIMTKDKIEELARELTEKGDISEKEGKELVDELWKKTEQAKKDMETKMEKMLHKVLEKMDLTTKKDIVRLEQRIEELEKKDREYNKPDNPE